MLSQLSFPRLGNLLDWSSYPSIELPPVQSYDVETGLDKRARALKHLLKANHVNHAIIYHNLQFHNHMPHILGSAFILGASPAQLNTIYDEEAKSLEPWKDSPGEIAKHDWRDYLGERRYQRAFVDFFEDQLVEYGYDWRQLVMDYFFTGKDPLINNIVCGLGHPLIHLGYAFEISSREIAIESLALTTTFYNFLHKYLDDSTYTRKPSYIAKTPLDILRKVSEDTKFNDLFDEQGSSNIEPLFNKREDEVLDHWNAWQITNPKEQFEDSQKTAVALLVATHPPESGVYDFFLVHLLTTSHAIRILLPYIPKKFHVPVVRQWWLFTIAVYIAQLRPPIKFENITDYDLRGRDWKWVTNVAINGKHATDAHYVKAIRAMKVASETWGDDDRFYLKAATKFADTFDNWGGFGALSPEAEEYITQNKKWYGT